MVHRFNPTEYAGRKQTIEAAKAAVARLQQIEANIDAATTAQLKAALKDIATYERHLIRIVVGGL